MTTPTTARAARRPLSSSSATSSPSSTPGSSLISKGGTARSAVSSPRVQSSLSSSSTPTRKTSLRNSTTPPPAASALHTNGSGNNDSEKPGSATLTRERLADALRNETEEKETLIVKLQDHQQQIQTLHSESDDLKSSLKAAEERLAEFYSDQARIEDELAAHHAIAEKLREQLRESEKEKRDLLRRYNEQTQSFEAERQSFYDNEQHLKSRIQSLTQSRKAPDTPLRSAGRQPSSATLSATPGVGGDEEQEEAQESFSTEEEQADEAQAPTLEEDIDTPEVSALKLELSTLSTSYGSLQVTLQHLQTQLSDLQRVNNHLQDENESYNILLRERTMNGQFDILRQLGGDDSSVAEGDTDGRSVRSTNRSTLDRVSEVEELAMEDESSDIDPFEERPPSRTSGRRARSGTASPMAKGESLAGLPLTGPGLDLAAELGRAESREPMDQLFNTVAESPVKGRNKRTRVAEIKAGGVEVDTLRTEVKSLKEANKALSLYASKILDRIIAQEGFEQVLAVDYTEDNPKSPQTAVPSKSPPKKARPQSAFFFAPSLLSSGPASQKEEIIEKPQIASPASPDADARRQRRSMSFDWKSLSPWSAVEKKNEPTNLRPLTLRPGAASVVGAKKLETQEDEEDRIERERLHATMKLMGIDQPPKAPLIAKAASQPQPSNELEKPAPNKSANRRWSLFRSTSNPPEPAETSNGPPLTAEALQHAEANEALKQLDERERIRMEQLAKGLSAGSDLTEIKPRASLSDEWRSRRDARLAGSTGSASTGTVWSAGREEGSSSVPTKSPYGSP